MDNYFCISIIIIGRNSQNTLDSCIKSLKFALQKASFIQDYEIIYVDSKSTDNSVKIAKENNVKVIEIIDGYTSAALGRYLGKKVSKYQNILFLDSDMYLDENWFINSKKYYDKYGAIIGDRYERLYKNNKVIKEIPKFYNIKTLKVAKRIGGFLMIKKNLIKDINYTPLLKDEEEKDFYAKFYKKTKIYEIPINAYIHNNYNLTTSRIKGYLNPYTKNGYILSLIKSIKDGYFMSYIELQKKYLLCIMISIIFYLFIGLGYYIWAFIILGLLIFNGIRNFKGSIMTTLFFPYKILTTLMILNKNLKSKYVYENKKYELKIKL